MSLREWCHGKHLLDQMESLAGSLQSPRISCVKKSKHLFNACLKKGRFPSMENCWLGIDPETGQKQLAGCFIIPPNMFDKWGWKDDGENISWSNYLTLVGPNISDNQYGFRAGRSSIDAIETVTSVVRRTVARGGIVLVSIDIPNAFNFLPWSAIKMALKRHGIPDYLRKIIDI